MLQSEPKLRPKIEQLIQHEFIVSGYCPSSLPVTALTMAPRFANFDVSLRKPLLELNNGKLLFYIF